MTDNEELKRMLNEECDRTMTVPLEDASERILNLKPGDTTPFSKQLHNGQITQVKIQKKILTEKNEIIIAGDTT